MKVLIIGVNGMLGHQLYRVLGRDHEIRGTVRGGPESIARWGFFDAERITTGIDVTDRNAVARAIDAFKPEAVVNAAGVVKSLEPEAGAFTSLRVNALFPHTLYWLCQQKGIRVIHVSTDCVFSGEKGTYTEDDPSDATDVYGRSKYQGEITGAGALTIRTSMIGRELGTRRGLLEWFISNRDGTVNGYTKAIFSGFPTLHLARIIGDILVKHPDLTGLYHVAAEPISKYELLRLINTAMKLNITINEYPDEVCDRSLDATRFREATGFAPEPWHKMIAEMAADYLDREEA